MNMQFLRGERAAYRTSTQTHMVKLNCSWPHCLTSGSQGCGDEDDRHGDGKGNRETTTFRGAATGRGGRPARRRRGSPGEARERGRGRGGRPARRR